MAYKYFLYSPTQESFFKKVEESMGRTFKVGTVFYKGIKKSFTEISSTPNNQFSDSRIVAEGEETSFKYDIPRGV